MTTPRSALSITGCAWDDISANHDGNCVPSAGAFVAHLAAQSQRALCLPCSTNLLLPDIERLREGLRGG